MKVVKQQILTGDDRAGICVYYVKSKKTIRVFGWYDSIVGIKSEEIPLKDFLFSLNISEDDIKKALGR